MEFLKKHTGIALRRISNLILLFFLITVSVQLIAVPATPHPIIITQPDGTKLTIRLRGDEFFNYKTTEDGYLVQLDSDGFYKFAQQDEEGNIIPTNIKATNVSERSSVANSFLKGISPVSYNFTTIQQTRKTARVASSATAQDAYPLTGSPRSLVILIEFANLSFVVENPETAFHNLLNEVGYSENGGTGSARDYFIASSDSAFSPQFDVFGPYKLDNDFAYYGANDADDYDLLPAQMVLDACAKANGDINFADYDTDGDGRVDNIFIFYAGHNEAEGAPANTIWPHRWVVAANNSTGTRVFDGKTIYDYACTSELKGNSGVSMCGIGTFVHEFGHVLGLPDFYATNGATHHTLSSWSVMDYGPYLNNGRTPPAYSAYERFFLDWLAPEELLTTSDYSLPPITQSNKAFIVTTEGNHNLNGANPTPTQFFMLENRQRTGWDAFLPGHGLLITRINYNASTWNANTVNNNASAMGVDIIEADRQASNNNLSGDPFPGTGNVTNYSFTTRSGQTFNKYIYDITEKSDTIVFDFLNTNLEPPINTPEQVIDTTIYGFTIKWNRVESAQSYYIYLKANEGTNQYALEKWLTDTTYTFANLDAKSKYTYYLVASTKSSVSAEEIISANSDEVEVTTLPIILDKPINTSAQVIDTGIYSFKIQWNNVEFANSYYIYFKGTTDVNQYVLEKWLTDTTYTFSNLNAGSTYSYYLVASTNLESTSSKEFISDNSDEVEVTTLEDTPNGRLNVINNSDGDLIVEVPDTSDLLMVYDISGKIIQSIQPDSNTTPIYNLAKGHIYIIRSGSKWAKIFR